MLIACELLHKLFWGLPEFSETLEDIIGIPFSNGIYVFFEKGEWFEGGKRIVRVGTHGVKANSSEQNNQLLQRLKSHLVIQNKDRSIFRKNVGRAILNKRNDSYLPIWNLDLTSRAVRKANSLQIDRNYQQQIEDEVSNYMKEHFSFTCIKVDSREERRRFEEGIISSLHNDKGFQPSTSWLGNSSPIAKIRESGMWLTQGLNGEALTEREIERVQQLCKESF